jgi:hypothetical protein
MTDREEIMRMAAESGLTHPMNCISHGVTERFAALVAAAERDRMISEGWRQCAQGQKTSQFCAVAEQVRQEEREECAKVCEEQNARWADDRRAIYATDECAAAIRARGEK